MSERRPAAPPLPTHDALTGHAFTMDLAAVKAAAARTAGRLHITPLLSSIGAAEALRRSGGPLLGDGRVRLKSEHLQRTGSYKVRGMLNRVTQMVEHFGEDEVRRRGLITFSAGNAAAAYAWAGRQFGIPVHVVMPRSAVSAKIAACTSYGATVHLVDGLMGEAGELKDRLIEERGLFDAHPFDDPYVIAGHGTLGLEILDQFPETDVVIGGLGGGGMLCGTAVALRAMKPGIRIYGVEPDGSAAVKLAVEAGSIVPIQPKSIADGLGAPYAGSWTLPLASSLMDACITLPDEEILGGLRFLAERCKQVVEPAGAAALAALLFGRVPVAQGDRVVVILSGGNVDLPRIPEFLERGSAVPGA